MFHTTLAKKIIRRVPEGLCTYCSGTGLGEEIADMGEAFFRGSEFPTPIKTCTSCGGSGQTRPKTKLTTLGLLLLFLLPAIIALSFSRKRLTAILYLGVLFALGALLLRAIHRFERTEETTK